MRHYGLFIFVRLLEVREGIGTRRYVVKLTAGYVLYGTQERDNMLHQRQFKPVCYLH